MDAAAASAAAFCDADGADGLAERAIFCAVSGPAGLQNRGAGDGAHELDDRGPFQPASSKSARVRPGRQTPPTWSRWTRVPPIVAVCACGFPRLLWVH